MIVKSGNRAMAFGRDGIQNRPYTSQTNRIETKASEDRVCPGMPTEHRWPNRALYLGPAIFGAAGQKRARPPDTEPRLVTLAPCQASWHIRTIKYRGTRAPQIQPATDGPRGTTPKSKHCKNAPARRHHTRRKAIHPQARKMTHMTHFPKTPALK